MNDQLDQPDDDSSSGESFVESSPSSSDEQIETREPAGQEQTALNLSSEIEEPVERQSSSSKSSIDDFGLVEIEDATLIPVIAMASLFREGSNSSIRERCDAMQRALQKDAPATSVNQLVDVLENALSNGDQRTVLEFLKAAEASDRFLGGSSQENALRSRMTELGVDMELVEHGLAGAHKPTAIELSIKAESSGKELRFTSSGLTTTIDWEAERIESGVVQGMEELSRHIDNVRNASSMSKSAAEVALLGLYNLPNAMTQNLERELNAVEQHLQKARWELRHQNKANARPHLQHAVEAILPTLGKMAQRLGLPADIVDEFNVCFESLGTTHGKYLTKLGQISLNIYGPNPINTGAHELAHKQRWLTLDAAYQTNPEAVKLAIMDNCIEGIGKPGRLSTNNATAERHVFRSKSAEESFKRMLRWQIQTEFDIGTPEENFRFADVESELTKEFGDHDAIATELRKETQNYRKVTNQFEVLSLDQASQRYMRERQKTFERGSVSQTWQSLARLAIHNLTTRNLSEGSSFSPANNKSAIRQEVADLIGPTWAARGSTIPEPILDLVIESGSDILNNRELGRAQNLVDLVSMKSEVGKLRQYVSNPFASAHEVTQEALVRLAVHKYLSEQLKNREPGFVAMDHKEGICRQLKRLTSKGREDTGLRVSAEIIERVLGQEAIVVTTNERAVTSEIARNLANPTSAFTSGLRTDPYIRKLLVTATIDNVGSGGNAPVEYAVSSDEIAARKFDVAERAKRTITELRQRQAVVIDLIAEELDIRTEATERQLAELKSIYARGVGLQPPADHIINTVLARRGEPRERYEAQRNDVRNDLISDEGERIVRLQNDARQLTNFLTQCAVEQQMHTSYMEDDMPKAKEHALRLFGLMLGDLTSNMHTLDYMVRTNLITQEDLKGTEYERIFSCDGRAACLAIDRLKGGYISSYVGGDSGNQIDTPGILLEAQDFGQVRLRNIRISDNGDIRVTFRDVRGQTRTAGPEKFWPGDFDQEFNSNYPEKAETSSRVTQRNGRKLNTFGDFVYAVQRMQREFFQTQPSSSTDSKNESDFELREPASDRHAESSARETLSYLEIARVSEGEPVESELESRRSELLASGEIRNELQRAAGISAERASILEQQLLGENTELRERAANEIARLYRGGLRAFAKEIRGRAGAIALCMAFLLPLTLKKELPVDNENQSTASWGR